MCGSIPIDSYVSIIDDITGDRFHFAGFVNINAVIPSVIHCIAVNMIYSILAIAAEINSSVIKVINQVIRNLISVNIPDVNSMLIPDFIDFIMLHRT